MRDHSKQKQTFTVLQKTGGKKWAKSDVKKLVNCLGRSAIIGLHPKHQNVLILYGEWERPKVADILAEDDFSWAVSKQFGDEQNLPFKDL